METWQICVAAYLAVAAGVAVIIFKNRTSYSPARTETIPAIIASLLSGLAWGIAFPVTILKLVLVQVKREAK